MASTDVKCSECGALNPCDYTFCFHCRHPPKKTNAAKPVAAQKTSTAKPVAAKTKKSSSSKKTSKRKA